MLRHEKGPPCWRPFFVDLPPMPVAAMVKPRTIEPRTAIVGECRANHAAVANDGIIRLVVVPAVVSRGIAAVVSRISAAIISVTRAVGVGAGREAADYS